MNPTVAQSRLTIDRIATGVPTTADSFSSRTVRGQGPTAGGASNAGFGCFMAPHPPTTFLAVTTAEGPPGGAVGPCPAGYALDSGQKRVPFWNA